MAKIPHTCQSMGYKTWSLLPANPPKWHVEITLEIGKLSGGMSWAVVEIALNYWQETIG
jgi:hypothetical protein